MSNRKDCSAMGAIAGAWTGLVAAIIAWCSTAATQNDGTVSVDTLGQVDLLKNICVYIYMYLICEVLLTTVGVFRVCCCVCVCVFGTCICIYTHVDVNINI